MISSGGRVKEEIRSLVDLGDRVAGILASRGLASRGRGNPGRKTKTVYRDLVCAFDIETAKSVINGQWQSWLYTWQYALGHTVFLGRCWPDYSMFLSIINANLGDRERLVTYVHNLSFEFQFLSGIYDFRNEDVFAVKPHKILKATERKIEYRCSMLHSNMSLARWTAQMQVAHKKKSGEDFDYKEIRYPWTPLTDDQIGYCVNDVLGVVEAIEKELLLDDDTLYSIPLTSTGYVRRDVKRAMKPVTHRLMYQLHMEQDVYEMLRRAFRGGDTHANRYFVNRILRGVKSYDRSSSYPDVMLNRLFPMSKFLPDPYVLTLDDVIESVYQRERACLVDMAFYKYDQADIFNGFPYLSLSKCRNVSGDAVIDNGRILSASYFETTLTDVDLRIVLKEVSGDCVMVPLNYKSARYGPLPAQLRETVLNYYVKKTELKGNPEQDYYYNKSKNKLNSTYGMTVQDPCKDNILYDEGDFNLEGIPVSELLDKYYKNCFTSYAWGVWITAWARFELRRALWLVGRDAVYCDTDSVKFVGDHDFTDLNKSLHAASVRSGAHATDSKGKTHYMGVYEYEGQYDEFATLGAKKYCYTTGGKLHITIAGVNKVKGAEELERAGGISKFLLGTENTIGTGEPVLNEKGFIFREGGGNELIYNMDKYYYTLHIDCHDLPITRNVVIKDSTYQLGLSRDYRVILEGIAEEYLEEYEY